MKYILFLFLIFPLKLTYACDEDHLKRIHEQIQSGQRICAVEFNLQGADLKGKNFKAADFSGANLKGVDFSDANLSEAVFKEANLSKANFQRANLTRVMLEGAIVNGAKFKKARLLGVEYQKLRSAKGTLFEDKKEAKKKITYEEKIESIVQDFYAKRVLSIPIDLSSSLTEIHGYLFEEFNKLAMSSEEYIILDFGSQEFSHHDISDLDFLKAPLFKNAVKSILPICNHHALIVFLNTKNTILPKRNSYRPFLDLHGKTSIDVKYKWINEFIRKSFLQRIYTVEIVTGRGLHNPQGKMGILWRLCHKYLIRKEFKPYIREIHSISKQGGWRITLKTGKKNLKKKEENSPLLSFYGPTMFSGESKVSLVSRKESIREKKIITPLKKSKKSKE